MSDKTVTVNFKPTWPELRDAILTYKEVVAKLFAMRSDGPCLAERRPTQDTECLSAFQQLDAAGKVLQAMADAIREST
jgi:hypothetical protein